MGVRINAKFDFHHQLRGGPASSSEKRHLHFLGKTIVVVMTDGMEWNDPFVPSINVSITKKIFFSEWMKVNVALSDLLMTCLNIPFSVSRVLLDHWPFGDFLCSLFPFVQVMSVYVSSLTMAAIAVDRYRVILTPLKRRLRPPHGLVIMLVLWILASLAALPYALYSEVVPIFTYRSAFLSLKNLRKTAGLSRSVMFSKAFEAMPGQIPDAGPRIPPLFDAHHVRNAVRHSARDFRPGLRRHRPKGIQTSLFPSSPSLYANL